MHTLENCLLSMICTSKDASMWGNSTASYPQKINVMNLLFSYNYIIAIELYGES